MKTKPHPHPFRLSKGEKWFSAYSNTAEEWWGPWGCMEDALLEAVCDDMFFDAEHDKDRVVYVCKGRKLTKAEREDMGVSYDWEVDSPSAIKIVVPPTIRSTGSGV